MGTSFKRMLSILLTLTLALGIVGCSKDGEKSSMGRYVEERYEVPEGVEVQTLSLLENDKIGMIGYSREDWKPVAFISEDGGKTWTQNSIDLPKEEGKETYTNNIVYLSNGTILLIRKRKLTSFVTPLYFKVYSKRFLYCNLFNSHSSYMVSTIIILIVPGRNWSTESLAEKMVEMNQDLKL